MTLLIASADLAELYAGKPMVLLLDGHDAAALNLPGLLPWLVSGHGAGHGTGHGIGQEGAMRLHRPGTPAECATLPVPLPPAQVLAIVTRDAAAAAALLAWWSAAGPDVPPLLEAPNAEAALPGLARLMAGALEAQARTAAGLHRALAAARQDAEESREAMVSLIRHGTQAGPPPMPVQILALQPAAAGPVLEALDGRLSAGQCLGVPLESLSGLALHLAEAQAAPAALLRVRLYGAESGRIAGAWLVPGEALVPGWLTLDLPTPIGPLRESACLDLTAELELGDSLALSLDQRPCSPDRAVAVAVADDPGPGGADHDRPHDRPLALRAWTAPFGRRFVIARHWDAEAIDLPLAPFGTPPAVPVRLPAQIWDAARFPAGQVEWVALGTETPRLLASFGAGRRVAIVLPGIPVNGLDLLQATLTVGRGDPAQLEAALWLQADDGRVATEAELSLEQPDARWSGWRRPWPVAGQPPVGGRLLLPLALPLHGPRRVTVVLVLHHAGSAPAQPLRVEWSDLVGMRGHCPPPRAPARRPLPPVLVSPVLVPPVLAPPVQSTAPPPAIRVPAAPPREVPGAPSPPPEPASAQMALARLQEHFATPDGGYRHLDIWLEDVRAGSQRWPRLRFKFALRGEGPAIEFRNRPDWPGVFATWPGTEADTWGPFLLLQEADLATGLAQRLPDARDRRMLATLVTLLPQAVSQVMRESPAAAAEATLWMRQALRLVAALRQPAA